MQKLLIASVLVFSTMIFTQEIKAATETAESVAVDVTKEADMPSEKEMKELEKEMEEVGKEMEETGKKIEEEAKKTTKEMESAEPKAKE